MRQVERIAYFEGQLRQLTVQLRDLSTGFHALSNQVKSQEAHTRKVSQETNDLNRRCLVLEQQNQFLAEQNAQLCQLLQASPFAGMSVEQVDTYIVERMAALLSAGSYRGVDGATHFLPEHLRANRK